MATIVYVLCAMTSALCAWMLFSSYRRNQVRLLFWSALGFTGLFLNNVMLIFDRVIFPDVELTIPRLLPAVVGMVVIIYGLVMEGP